MIKKSTFFKSFIVSAAFVTGLSATAQKSLYLNFEDDTKASDWVLENASDNVTANIVEPSTSARSGSKVIEFSAFNRSTGFHIKNTVDHIVMAPGEYIHSMVWGGTIALDGAVAPKAAGTFSSTWSSPTPGAWKVLSTTDVSTQVFEGSVRQYPEESTDDLLVYPRFRVHPNGNPVEGKIAYFDDFVLYCDTNKSFDFIAPEAATAFSFVNQTATSNEMSWTEGVDTLTGVQMTYILRTTNATAEAPVLMSQMGFSVDETIDDWTVIATVDAGTTSYTDNSVLEGETYTYAIVHKDLAYNNSVALLSTDVPTAINKKSVSAFKCFSVKDGIQLNALSLGETLEVYNISGMRVVAKSISTTSLSVELPKGIYIVRVADAVTKVAVR